MDWDDMRINETDGQKCARILADMRSHAHIIISQADEIAAAVNRMEIENKAMRAEIIERMDRCEACGTRVSGTTIGDLL